jgi:tetratricopeptide (TPR) repeat protein
VSSFIGEKDRKIVPRWRSFRGSAVSPTSDHVDIASHPLSSSLQSNIDDWKKEGSLWTALDLVAGAIVENRPDVAADAFERIRVDPSTPKAALALIDEHEKNSSLDVDNDLPVEQRCRAEIRSSRIRLSNYPFDAIEWIDLARSFTTLGFLDKASRCIAAALTLAPADIFVLRSASRFHIQQGDPDRAQWILTKCPRTLGNPWLLASEIAAASVAGRDSQLVKIARRIEQADFRPEDLTELRAAIATFEIEAGSNTQGKKLLRRSLDGANENSLAQVQWIDRTRLGNIIDISKTKPPHRHEARAWSNFFESKWKKSAACALEWFVDQPFSANAGIFCSYVLSDLLDLPAQALEVLDIALRSNSDNHTLNNNLAYAYIQLGQLDKAEGTLRALHINPDSTDDATVEATLGLLSFRRGLFDQGRLLYENAIKTFQRLGVQELSARAAIYLAIEEVRLRTPVALSAAKRALDMTKDKPRSDVAMKLDQLQAALRDWVGDTDEHESSKYY